MPANRPSRPASTASDQKLTKLIRFLSALNQASTIDELLPAIVAETERLLDADRTSVWFLNRQRTVVDLVAHRKEHAVRAG